MATDQVVPPLPEGFTPVTTPPLPEGFTPVADPSLPSLPEGFKPIEYPSVTPQQKIYNAVGAMDKAQFQKDADEVFNQAIKVKATSEWYSALTGVSATKIAESLPAFSKAHGGTGNLEADYQNTIGRVYKQRALPKALKASDGNLVKSILAGTLIDGINVGLEAILARGKDLVSWAGDMTSSQATQARGRAMYLKSQIKQLEKQMPDGEWDVETPAVRQLREYQQELDMIGEFLNARKYRNDIVQKISEWEAEVRAGRVLMEQDLAVDEDFAESFGGQLARASGNFVYSMGMFGAGPLAGFTANTASIYQSTINDARAHGATEEEAFDAGVAQLPAAVLDAAVDKFLFTRFLKPLKGKMTVGQLLAGVSAATASGAMSEGAEQLWQNINAVYLSKYDPDRMLDEGVLGAMAIGGILSGGATSVTSSANRVLPLPKPSKVQVSAPTEAEWKMIRKNETDEEIVQRGGPVALMAANGDLDAQAAIADVVEGRVKHEGDLGPLQQTPGNEMSPPKLKAQKDDYTDFLSINEELKQPLLDPETLKLAESIAIPNDEAAPSVIKEVTSQAQDLTQPLMSEADLDTIFEELDFLPKMESAKRMPAHLRKISDLESQIQKLKESKIDQKQSIETRLKREKAEAVRKLRDQKDAQMQKAVAYLREQQARRIQETKERAALKLAKEVNRRLDLVKKHFEQRQNLQESVGLLAEFAKMLPRQIRGDVIPRMKKLINRVSPEAQSKVMDSAIDLMRRRFDKFLAMESRAKFRKLEASQTKEINDARAANKTPSRELDAIAKYMEEHGLLGGEKREIALKRVKEIEERLDKEGEPAPFTPDEEDAMRISMLPDLSDNNLTHEEYQQAIRDLESLRDSAMTEWEAKQLQRQTKINSQIELIINEIAARLADKGKNALNPNEIEEYTSRLRLLKDADFALMDYRRLSTILSGKRTDSRIKKFIFDRISNAMSDSILAHDDYVRFIKDLESLYKVNIGVLSGQPLVRIGTRDLSYSEAMFIYGHSQNRAGLRHLRHTEVGGLRLDGDNLQTVLDAVPDNLKQFVDHIIDYNDMVMYPRLNEMFKRIYGISMPRVERYLPISNLRFGNAMNNIFEEAHTIAATQSSFLKARTKKSKLPFRNLDLIDVIFRHNQAAEHTIAMREVLTMVHAVLKDKRLQSRIGGINKKALRWINEYMVDVARGKMAPPNSDLIAAMRLIRNNSRTFFIAANPGSWLKTQAPIISAAQDVGKGALLSTLLRPWNAKSNWEAAREKSKFMRTRKTTSRIERVEMEEAKGYFRDSKVGKGFAKAANKTSRAMVKMQETAYWVYTPLDLASTSAVWVAKYREVLSKTANETEAIRQADEVVKVHFPTGRVEELPPVFRSGGMEKEITVFASDMNKMFNLGFTKVQLKDKRIQEAIVFGVYSLVLSALFLGATDIPWDGLREIMGVKKPETERGTQYLRDSAGYAVSQAVGGIPLVNFAAEAAVARLAGDTGKSEMLIRQTPIWAYPGTQVGRGQYASAILSAAGVPGGNLIGPLIDDYLKGEE